MESKVNRRDYMEWRGYISKNELMDKGELPSDGKELAHAKGRSNFLKRYSRRRKVLNYSTTRKRRRSWSNLVGSTGRKSSARKKF